MDRSILLGCYEVPGYGGASTATYQLFQLMRRDNLLVSFVNLIDGNDAAYYRYTFGQEFGNPDQASDTYNFIFDGPLYDPHPKLAGFLKAISPDVIIGVDAIAMLLLKRESPETKSVFMTTGCRTMQDLMSADLSKDFITHLALLRSDPSKPQALNREELTAVELADLVVTHSDSVHSLYDYFYPDHSGKLLADTIWFAEWIYGEALKYSHLSRPFSERAIEVLFIASSWARFEKNYGLVRQIVRQLNSSRVHIVGSVATQVPGAVFHGFEPVRRNVFDLIGQAKTVVCPSLFDAAPGILFEAAALGCNVIASRNCGNWQLCNNELLVERFSLAEFMAKIALSLTREFRPNINPFLEKRGYLTLLETLAVI